MIKNIKTKIAASLLCMIPVLSWADTGCDIPTPPSADTNSYEVKFSGNTVYRSKTHSSNWTFTPSSVPRYGTKIKKVTWDYQDYQNGFSVQDVELCYIKQYKTI